LLGLHFLSIALRRFGGNSEQALHTCTILGIIVTTLLVFAVPQVATAAIWVLLPSYAVAAVSVISWTADGIRMSRQAVNDKFHEWEWVSRQEISSPRCSSELQLSLLPVFHIAFAFIGLTLLLDNLLAWIPTFMFYLDSIYVIEILAWLIGFLASIIIWPLLHILRPGEVNGLLFISVVLLIVVAVLELTLPFCGSCARPLGGMQR